MDRTNEYLDKLRQLNHDYADVHVGSVVFTTGDVLDQITGMDLAGNDVTVADSDRKHEIVAAVKRHWRKWIGDYLTERAWECIADVTHNPEEG